MKFELDHDKFSSIKSNKSYYNEFKKYLENQIS